MAHPGFIKPQLATLRPSIPHGRWLYEVKFNRFTFIHSGIEKLPDNIVVDGELISAEPSGRSNFSQLQADIKSGRQERLAFYAFDILYLGGQDLRKHPQLERKTILEKLLGKKVPGIHYSEHETRNPEQMLADACKMNLEGLIAKNPEAPYRSDRNEHWLKLKCTQTDNFFVIGYELSSTGIGVGALRLANKKMVYCGKVGTGFSNKVSIELQKKLDKLRIPEAPVKVPKKKNTRWTKPTLKAKVEYRDITSDGMLRHASFKCLA